MVNDDELERHLSRVEDGQSQPADVNGHGGTGDGSNWSVEDVPDSNGSIEELEASLMRVAEELSNRIEDVDRGMPPAESVTALGERLSAIEDRLAAIEDRLDESDV